MRPVEAEALRILSHMPLIDRLEAVAVSGRSRSAVYNAFDTLESGGLAASVPHASELIPSTRRYFPTADGLRRIAADEGIPVDDLLRSRPVSAQWRRVLVERLDAVAVIYRLASAVSGIERPIRFRWYRAMPVDAAVALPDGRVIAVVRQGTATDRTGYSKRLWRLRQGERPAAVLMLMPDETRLRHARRLLAGAPASSPTSPLRATPHTPEQEPRSGARRRGRRFSTSGSRWNTPENEAHGPERRRGREHLYPVSSTT